MWERPVRSRWLLRTSTSRGDHPAWFADSVSQLLRTFLRKSAATHTNLASIDTNLASSCLHPLEVLGLCVCLHLVNLVITTICLGGKYMWSTFNSLLLHAFSSHASALPPVPSQLPLSQPCHPVRGHVGDRVSSTVARAKPTPGPVEDQILASGVVGLWGHNC